MKEHILSVIELKEKLEHAQSFVKSFNERDKIFNIKSTDYEGILINSL